MTLIWCITASIAAHTAAALIIATMQTTNRKNPT